MIDDLYQYLAERPTGADAEELLAVVFGKAGGDPAFGQEFLSALLADDPRFLVDDTGERWSLADKHLLDEPVGEAPFVVVDLETTGQRPEESGITEIGAVLIRGGLEVNRFETLVNPGKAIPPYVSTLTGITDAMVAGAPPIEEVLPRFVAFAGGTVLVAHNAAFDVALLDRASRRVLGRPLGLPSLCTFKLARRLLPELTKASLDGLAAHFGLAKSARHRALADAELTAAILARLVRILASKGPGTVNALLEAQEDPASPRRLEVRIPRGRLEALPEAPGVLWLLEETGQCLFVGQADNLRGRVVSYFAGRTHLSDRQFDMVSRAVDVGFRRAASGLERALIEAEEIRGRNPLFNRPDRHLPRGSFVKIQRRGRYPRVLVTTRIAGDGATYLGPIKSRQFADDAAALVAKAFGLRTCAGSLHPAPEIEPCWLGPAGWCASPCNAKIASPAYRAQVDEAVRTLERDPSALRAIVTRERSGEHADGPSRDVAVIGRLAKLHRKRHWLVNEHHYVAAFPAEEGGFWIAIVVRGICRRLRRVLTAEDLRAALTRDGRLDHARRVGHFDADASTILAHWTRRSDDDEGLAVIDLDEGDLEGSLAAAGMELASLVEAA